MKDPLKIIGANGNRRENDFYPTPPECTYALLDYLRQNFLLRSTDTIWEPACGSNAMVDVMTCQGYPVIATEITQGQDFLEYEMQDHFDWIITNPPFSLSEKFIKRCIEHGKPFALLLKSQHWHSAKRRDLFHSHPPLFVLPLTWRPDFTGKGSSMLDMVWTVWVGNSKSTYYEPLAKPKRALTERRP